MSEQKQKIATFWTLQQFCNIVGRPWYTLQQQDDGGVIRQLTGYRHEVDGIARSWQLEYEELPATTEPEFLGRFE